MGTYLDRGEGEARVSREIQQDRYTGSKKLHGMKWQSITLVNGMDFHIWGPVSMRKPDMYNLTNPKQKTNLEIFSKTVY